ncbi:MAG: hypothetical protein U9R08_00735 [Nanoarchaeota archaeon]|nr:hypothetical protein [Nanoarchaeota archaeon]
MKNKEVVGMRTISLLLIIILVMSTVSFAAEGDDKTETKPQDMNLEQITENIDTLAKDPAQVRLLNPEVIKLLGADLITKIVEHLGDNQYTVLTAVQIGPNLNKFEDLQKLNRESLVTAIQNTATGLNRQISLEFITDARFSGTSLIAPDGQMLNLNTVISNNIISIVVVKDGFVIKRKGPTPGSSREITIEGDGDLTITSDDEGNVIVTREGKKVKVISGDVKFEGKTVKMDSGTEIDIEGVGGLKSGKKKVLFDFDWTKSQALRSKSAQKRNSEISRRGKFNKEIENAVKELTNNHEYAYVSASSDGKQFVGTGQYTFTSKFGTNLEKTISGIDESAVVDSFMKEGRRQFKVDSYDNPEKGKNLAMIRSEWAAEDIQGNKQLVNGKNPFYEFVISKNGAKISLGMSVKSLLHFGQKIVDSKTGQIKFGFEALEPPNIDIAGVTETGKGDTTIRLDGNFLYRIPEIFKGGIKSVLDHVSKSEAAKKRAEERAEAIKNKKGEELAKAYDEILKNGDDIEIKNLMVDLINKKELNEQDEKALSDILNSFKEKKGLTTNDYTLLAQTAGRLGRKDEFKLNLEKAVAGANGERLATIAKNLVGSYLGSLDQNDFNKAKDLMKNIIADNKLTKEQKDEALANYANNLLKMHQYSPELRQQYESSINNILESISNQRTKNEIKGELEARQTVLSARGIDELKGSLDKLIENNPNNADFIRQRASAHLAEGNFEEAKKLLEQGLGSKDVPESHKNMLRQSLALMYDAINDKEKSAKYWGELASNAVQNKEKLQKTADNKKVDWYKTLIFRGNVDLAEYENDQLFKKAQAEIKITSDQKIKALTKSFDSLAKKVLDTRKKDVALQTVEKEMKLNAWDNVPGISFLKAVNRVRLSVGEDSIYDLRSEKEAAEKLQKQNENDFVSAFRGTNPQVQTDLLRKYQNSGAFSEETLTEMHRIQEITRFTYLDKAEQENIIKNKRNVLDQTNSEFIALQLKQGRGELTNQIEIDRLTTLTDQVKQTGSLINIFEESLARRMTPEELAVLVKERQERTVQSASLYENRIDIYNEASDEASLSETVSDVFGALTGRKDKDTLEWRGYDVWNKVSNWDKYRGMQSLLGDESDKLRADYQSDKNILQIQSQFYSRTGNDLNNYFGEQDWAKVLTEEHGKKVLSSSSDAAKISANNKVINEWEIQDASQEFGSTYRNFMAEKTNSLGGDVWKAVKAVPVIGLTYLIGTVGDTVGGAYNGVIGDSISNSYNIDARYNSQGEEAEAKIKDSIDKLTNIEQSYDALKLLNIEDAAQRIDSDLGTFIEDHNKPGSGKIGLANDVQGSLQIGEDLIPFLFTDPNTADDKYREFKITLNNARDAEKNWEQTKEYRERWNLRDAPVSIGGVTILDEGSFDWFAAMRSWGTAGVQAGNWVGRGAQEVTGTLSSWTGYDLGGNTAFTREKALEDKSSLIIELQNNKEELAIARGQGENIANTDLKALHEKAMMLNPSYREFSRNQGIQIQEKSISDKIKNLASLSVNDPQRKNIESDIEQKRSELEQYKKRTLADLQMSKVHEALVYKDYTSAREFSKDAALLNPEKYKGVDDSLQNTLDWQDNFEGMKGIAEQTAGSVGAMAQLYAFSTPVRWLAHSSVGAKLGLSKYIGVAEVPTVSSLTGQLTSKQAWTEGLKQYMKFSTTFYNPKEWLSPTGEAWDEVWEDIAEQAISQAGITIRSDRKPGARSDGIGDDLVNFYKQLKGDKFDIDIKLNSDVKVKRNAQSTHNTRISSGVYGDAMLQRTNGVSVRISADPAVVMNELKSGAKFVTNGIVSHDLNNMFLGDMQAAIQNIKGQDNRVELAAAGISPVVIDNEVYEQAKEKGLAKEFKENLQNSKDELVIKIQSEQSAIGQTVQQDADTVRGKAKIAEKLSGQSENYQKLADINSQQAKIAQDEGDGIAATDFETSRRLNELKSLEKQRESEKIKGHDTVSIDRDISSAELAYEKNRVEQLNNKRQLREEERNNAEEEFKKNPSDENQEKLKQAERGINSVDKQIEDAESYAIALEFEQEFLQKVDNGEELDDAENEHLTQVKQIREARREGDAGNAEINDLNQRLVELKLDKESVEKRDDLNDEQKAQWLFSLNVEINALTQDVNALYNRQNLLNLKKKILIEQNFKTVDDATQKLNEDILEASDRIADRDNDKSEETILLKRGEVYSDPVNNRYSYVETVTVDGIKYDRMKNLQTSSETLFKRDTLLDNFRQGDGSTLRGVANSLAVATSAEAKIAWENKVARNLEQEISQLESEAATSTGNEFTQKLQELKQGTQRLFQMESENKRLVDELIEDNNRKVNQLSTQIDAAKDAGENDKVVALEQNKALLDDKAQKLEQNKEKLQQDETQKVAEGRDGFSRYVNAMTELDMQLQDQTRTLTGDEATKADEARLNNKIDMELTNLQRAADNAENNPNLDAKKSILAANLDNIARIRKILQEKQSKGFEVKGEETALVDEEKGLPATLRSDIETVDNAQIELQLNNPEVAVASEKINKDTMEEIKARIKHEVTIDNGLLDWAGNKFKSPEIQEEVREFKKEIQGMRDPDNKVLPMHPSSYLESIALKASGLRGDYESGKIDVNDLLNGLKTLRQKFNNLYLSDSNRIKIEVPAATTDRVAARLISLKTGDAIAKISSFRAKHGLRQLAKGDYIQTGGLASRINNANVFEYDSMFEDESSVETEQVTESYNSEEFAQLRNSINTGSVVISKADAKPELIENEDGTFEVKGDFLTASESASESVKKLTETANKIMKAATVAKRKAVGAAYTANDNQAEIILEALTTDGRIFKSKAGSGKTSVMIPFAAALKSKMSGKKVVLLFKKGSVEGELLPEIGKNLEFFTEQGLTAEVFDSANPKGDSDVIIADTDLFFEFVKTTSQSKRFIDNLKSGKGSALIADEAQSTLELMGRYSMTEGARQSINSLENGKEQKAVGESLKGLLDSAAKQVGLEGIVDRESMLTENNKKDLELREDIRNALYLRLAAKHNVNVPANADLEELIKLEVVNNPSLAKDVNMLNIMQRVLSETPETDYGIQEGEVVPRSKGRDSGRHYSSVAEVVAYELLGRDVLKSIATDPTTIGEADWNKAGVSLDSRQTTTQEMVADVFSEVYGFSGTPELVQNQIARNLGVSTRSETATDFLGGKEKFVDSNVANNVNGMSLEGLAQDSNKDHTWVVASDRVANPLAVAKILELEVGKGNPSEVIFVRANGNYESVKYDAAGTEVSKENFEDIGKLKNYLNSRNYEAGPRLVKIYEKGRDVGTDLAIRGTAEDMFVVADRSSTFTDIEQARLRDRGKGVSQNLFGEEYSNGHLIILGADTGTSLADMVAEGGIARQNEQKIQKENNLKGIEGAYSDIVTRAIRDIGTAERAAVGLSTDPGHVTELLSKWQVKAGQDLTVGAKSYRSSEEYLQDRLNSALEFLKNVRNGQGDYANIRSKLSFESLAILDNMIGDGKLISLELQDGSASLEGKKSLLDAQSIQDVARITRETTGKDDIPIETSGEPLSRPEAVQEVETTADTEAEQEIEKEAEPEVDEKVEVEEGKEEEKIPVSSIFIGQGFKFTQEEKSAIEVGELDLRKPIAANVWDERGQPEGEDEFNFILGEQVLANQENPSIEEEVQALSGLTQIELDPRLGVSERTVVVAQAIAMLPVEQGGGLETARYFVKTKIASAYSEFDDKGPEENWFRAERDYRRGIVVQKLQELNKENGVLTDNGFKTVIKFIGGEDAPEVVRNLPSVVANAVDKNIVPEMELASATRVLTARTQSDYLLSRSIRTSLVDLIGDGLTNEEATGMVDYLSALPDELKTSVHEDLMNRFVQLSKREVEGPVIEEEIIEKPELEDLIDKYSKPINYKELEPITSAAEINANPIAKEMVQQGIESGTIEEVDGAYFFLHSRAGKVLRRPLIIDQNGDLLIGKETIAETMSREILGSEFSRLMGYASPGLVYGEIEGTKYLFSRYIPNLQKVSSADVKKVSGSLVSVLLASPVEIYDGLGNYIIDRNIGNYLKDSQGNVWLIDFEGGVTEGYLPNPYEVSKQLIKLNHIDPDKGIAQFNAELEIYRKLASGELGYANAEDFISAKLEDSGLKEIFGEVEFNSKVQGLVKQFNDLEFFLNELLSFSQAVNLEIKANALNKEASELNRQGKLDKAIQLWDDAAKFQRMALDRSNELFKDEFPAVTDDLEADLEIYEELSKELKDKLEEAEKPEVSEDEKIKAKLLETTPEEGIMFLTNAREGLDLPSVDTAEGVAARVDAKDAARANDEQESRLYASMQENNPNIFKFSDVFEPELSLEEEQAKRDFIEMSDTVNALLDVMPEFIPKQYLNTEIYRDILNNLNQESEMADADYTYLKTNMENLLSFIDKSFEVAKNKVISDITSEVGRLLQQDKYDEAIAKIDGVPLELQDEFVVIRRGIEKLREAPQGLRKLAKFIENPDDSFKPFLADNFKGMIGEGQIFETREELWDIPSDLRIVTLLGKDEELTVNHIAIRAGGVPVTAETQAAYEAYQAQQKVEHPDFIVGEDISGSSRFTLLNFMLEELEKEKNKLNIMDRLQGKGTKIDEKILAVQKLSILSMRLYTTDLTNANRLFTILRDLDIESQVKVLEANPGLIDNIKNLDDESAAGLVNNVMLGMNQDLTYRKPKTLYRGMRLTLNELQTLVDQGVITSRAFIGTGITNPEIISRFVDQRIAKAQSIAGAEAGSERAAFEEHVQQDPEDTVFMSSSISDEVAEKFALENLLDNQVGVVIVIEDYNPENVVGYVTPGQVKKYQDRELNFKGLIDFDMIKEIKLVKDNTGQVNQDMLDTSLINGKQNLQSNIVDPVNAEVAMVNTLFTRHNIKDIGEQDVQNLIAEFGDFNKLLEEVYKTATDDGIPIGGGVGRVRSLTKISMSDSSAMKLIEFSISSVKAGKLVPTMIKEGQVEEASYELTFEDAKGILVGENIRSELKTKVLDKLLNGNIQIPGYEFRQEGINMKIKQGDQELLGFPMIGLEFDASMAKDGVVRIILDVRNKIMLAVEDIESDNPVLRIEQYNPDKKRIELLYYQDANPEIMNVLENEINKELGAEVQVEKEIIKSAPIKESGALLSTVTLTEASKGRVSDLESKIHQTLSTAFATAEVWSTGSSASHTYVPSSQGMPGDFDFLLRSESGVLQSENTLRAIIPSLEQKLQEIYGNDVKLQLDQRPAGSEDYGNTFFLRLCSGGCVYGVQSDGSYGANNEITGIDVTIRNQRQLSLDTTHLYRTEQGFEGQMDNIVSKLSPNDQELAKEFIAEQIRLLKKIFQQEGIYKPKESGLIGVGIEQLVVQLSDNQPVNNLEEIIKTFKKDVALDKLITEESNLKLIHPNSKTDLITDFAEGGRPVDFKRVIEIAKEYKEISVGSSVLVSQQIQHIGIQPTANIIENVVKIKEEIKC